MNEILFALTPGVLALLLSPTTVPSTDGPNAGAHALDPLLLGGVAVYL